MLSIIRDFAELESLRGEWSTLWREDPRATPFQSPEWILAWWRHLFRGGQLWTVVERLDGRLVSLAPLFRYGTECERLAFIGTGVSDYLDVIGSGIADIPGDWSVANLEEIRSGSPALELGPASACSVCPVVSLPATIDEYREQIEAKLAIDIRRSSNRLHNMGSIRIERTSSLEDLFVLHRARWRERSEEGVLATQNIENFHREVANGFSGLGILRVNQLLMDELVIAAVYAFTHRERTYAYLSGFDPTLSRASPGTVLLSHVIDEAIREGVREFDFLRNPEPYKYRWGARDQQNWQVCIAR